MNMKKLSIMMLMGSLCSFSTLAQAKNAHMCDSLAYDRYDTQASTLTVFPVSWDSLDEQAAITACTDAITTQPDNMRYVYQLGRAYYKAENYDKAHELHLKAAKQGYAAAMMALAEMYVNGEGVAESTEQAITWNHKAAKLGNYAAKVALIELYHESHPNKAKKLTQEILKTGSAAAQESLADYYYDIEAYEEAFKTSMKAAKRGDANAMFDVGYHYESGEGVAQSYENAATYYKRAVAKHNVDAMVNLGSLYDEGNGVALSDEKAFELYQQAADRGDIDAFYNLGVMYEDGEGVEQSNAMALKWYRKAAKRGDEDAAEAVTNLVE